MSSHYSTDYSRFKDIVDSDDSDEDKPGEEEEEEAAAADAAASAAGSDSDSLPDLLEGDEADDPAVEAAAAQWCAPTVSAAARAAMAAAAGRVSPVGGPRAPAVRREQGWAPTI